MFPFLINYPFNGSPERFLSRCPELVIPGEACRIPEF